MVRSSIRATRQLPFQFQLFFCTSLSLQADWNLPLVTERLQEATELTRPPSGWSPLRFLPVPLNSYSQMELQEFSTTAEMGGGHLPLDNSITATCAAKVFIYSQSIYSIFSWWTPGLFSSLFTFSPYLFPVENVHQHLNTHAWGRFSGLIINLPQICFSPVISESLQVDQQENKNYKKGEPQWQYSTWLPAALSWDIYLS